MRTDLFTFEVLTLPSRVAVSVGLGGLVLALLTRTPVFFVVFVVWELSLFVELDGLGKVAASQRSRFWAAFSLGLLLLASWAGLSFVAQSMELTTLEMSEHLLPDAAVSPVAIWWIVVLGHIVLGICAAAVEGRVLLEAFDLVETDEVQPWDLSRFVATQFLSIWMLFNYGRVRAAMLSTYGAETPG